jgi:predicted Fe-Mo cluster-binding NifX family protein
MKAAFAFLDDRIAPVFDTARRMQIVVTDGKQILSETQSPIPEEDALKRVKCLSDQGVEILVCGAVSTPLCQLLGSYGIKLIPFVAGNLRDVIQAWLKGELGQASYAMPGCQRRRCHRNTGQGQSQTGGRRLGRYCHERGREENDKD